MSPPFIKRLNSVVVDPEDITMGLFFLLMS